VSAKHFSHGVSLSRQSLPAPTAPVMSPANTCIGLEDPYGLLTESLRAAKPAGHSANRGACCVQRTHLGGGRPQGWVRMLD
jgi:hypothetical protein